jgi:N-acetylneuraminate synthase
MEFREPQWRELKDRAEKRNLKFLSSPFSIEAVELLSRVGVFAWKIASGEASNIPMLKRILKTKLPVLLSTGMSPLSEIDAAVGLIKKENVPFVLLQCTSKYPAPPEKIGLNMLSFFRQRHDCAVGISDHSGTIYPSLGAVMMGAGAIEVHVTMNRRGGRPDDSSSLTMAELKELVDGARFLEKALANPVDKDRLAQEMISMRRVFTKSIVAGRALREGDTILPEDLAAKKPGTGVTVSRIEEFIGRRVRRAIPKDEMLKEEDVG